MVAELEKLGLLEKIEPYKLEPRNASDQDHRGTAGVDAVVGEDEALAEPAIKAVEDGRITFVPENWSKSISNGCEYLRLVHFAATLVGASGPGVALRECGGIDGFAGDLKRLARFADQ